MNQNASTWLELPDLKGLSPEALAALNDRLRWIAAGIDAGRSAASPTATGAGFGQLMLTVPGTLGIRTDAAMRTSLPVAATPSGMVAIVKQTPRGASVKVKLLVAGANYSAIEIPVGSSAPVLIAGSLGGVIPANGIITLDLTQVGTDFPGADLSLLLRF